MTKAILNSNPLLPNNASAVQRAIQLRMSIIGLGLIVLLAAALRLYDLTALGSGNTYYTAAVYSMLQSPSNFFYGAAEPGGGVTVDKPPAGLWIQAASAAVFGISGMTVVLPQVIAGMLSILVLYHLVRRSYGVSAGLIAALSLAITPVVIVVDRNNTMDSTLILALMLAAWAFIKATETPVRGSRAFLWLIAGAAFVGIAFNIKMLQAFLPVPAFFALYALVGRGTWLRKLVSMMVAGMVLIGVSLSWAIVVDLTPADQRPYVGSSDSNSVIDLALGYNGLGRLFGVDHTGAVGQGGNNPLTPPSGAMPMGGMIVGSEIGTAGITRLVSAPLAKETSWLLPFASITLAGSAVMILRRGIGLLRAPLDAQFHGDVLWGGWLLVGVGFFSVASFFHAYYLAMIAPAMAALVGIGAARLWTLRETRPRRAMLMLVGMCAVTAAYQFYAAGLYLSDVGWFTAVIAIGVVGLALITVTLMRPARQISAMALTVLMSTILIVPLVWSIESVRGGTSIVLPSAWAGDQGRGFAPPPGSGLRDFFGGSEAVLEYVQTNQGETKYLMAVPSAGIGAEYVLETGEPVLYIGGFSGSDPIYTPESFAALVDSGDLRFVWDNGMLSMNQPEIVRWLQENCSVVESVEAGINIPDMAQMGIPPGGVTQGGQLPFNLPFAPNAGSAGAQMIPLGGGVSPALYDCGAA